MRIEWKHIGRRKLWIKKAWNFGRGFPDPLCGASWRGAEDAIISSVQFHSAIMNPALIRLMLLL